MEPSWQHQGFYYMNDNPQRSGDRSNISQHNDTPGSSAQDESAHRRAITHPSFLGAPPSHGPSSQMGLPPFSSSFYPSSHYSPGGHATSTSAPANMSLGYGGNHHNNQPMSAPGGGGGSGGGGGGGYPYSLTSPMNHQGLPLPMGRGPPGHLFHSESPRMPPGPPGTWSSSPGLRHLSPTSPTTHTGPSGVMTSSSTSSSSFPSATRTPGHLPHNAEAGMGGMAGAQHTGSIGKAKKGKTKRRGGSVEDSMMGDDSWDEEKYGPMADMGDDNDEQPWGMPQDEYKALNPRDKKQVRNRIGARRFRAKRKNYVTNLENSLRVREEECNGLRSQLEQHRAEINDLRSRLGMAPLANPPPPASLPPTNESGLGLLVNQPDGWEEGKSDA